MGEKRGQAVYLITSGKMYLSPFLYLFTEDLDGFFPFNVDGEVVEVCNDFLKIFGFDMGEIHVYALFIQGLIHPALHVFGHKRCPL